MLHGHLLTLGMQQHGKHLHHELLAKKMRRRTWSCKGHLRSLKEILKFMTPYMTNL
jgi:hypothetical protein